MAVKRLLERDTSQRSHIYKPLVQRKEVENNLVVGLVDSVFHGSTSRLVISALGHTKPTAEELEEIKSMIEKLHQDGMD